MLVLGNGLGYSTGPQLLSLEGLQMTGNIWYVSSEVGVDGASPAGKDEEAPLLTLSQAVTNAADNDLIVLAEDHDETLTSALTLSKKLTICGAKLTAGVPSAKLRLDAASGNLLTVTGTNVELSSIYVETNVQANSDPRIAVSGTSFAMHACYVNCYQYDDGAAVSLASGANLAYFHSTSFVSSATSLATRPESAIKTTAAISDLTLDGLVLDNGSYGFTNIYALDASAAAVTRLRIAPWSSGLSQLRGADMLFHSSTTGRLIVTTASGGARIDW